MSIPPYKTWTSSSQQKSSSGFTTHTSSDLTSLSSSPIDISASRSIHQPSSLSNSSSSVSHFPHVPSSLSKSVAVDDDDDVDPVFTSTINGNGISTLSSSFAAAAGAVAVVGKSKSKLRHAYIGPQVTTHDSDNEADADLVSMSRNDQIAAYEKFKRATRIQKIHEFHQEATQFDIELADKINTNSKDKIGIARMITQHEQAMLKLRTEKEEERRKLVCDERNRMVVEIKKGRSSSPSNGSGAAVKRGWVSSSSKMTTTKASPQSGITHSASTASIKIPVTSVPQPRTPLSTSSSIGAGFMNLDELQNVLEYAPDMPLDTALQITQLIGNDGAPGTFNPSQEHDQDWDTPQLHQKSSSNFGLRKRNNSISVLDDSRFDTISAKAKQRRDTITVSTTATTNHELKNGTNGYWKPQVRSPSPEESEAMTDQFARILLSTNESQPQTRASVTTRKGDNNDDFWGTWRSKPTPAPQITKSTLTTNANTSQLSAWTKKPVQSVRQPYSPTVITTSGWGTTTTKKKTLGAPNHWNQQVQNPNDDEAEEEGEVEGEEEGEGEVFVPFSPFSSGITSKRGPSLLSDMMTKGKNVVVGAVGAALGSTINGGGGSYPTAPVPITNKQKNSALASAISTSPLLSPAPATSTKGGKKARQIANKKAMPVSLMEPEVDEDEPQPHTTTPRATASTTKFTSTWGSQKNTFGVGSRNTVSPGGMWDDISTTPRPCGLSSTFSGNQGGASGSVRVPSGLHYQVWNAEEPAGEEQEQEQEEDEDEEDEGEENEWSIPGSLNTRRGGFGAAGAAKVGPGLSATSVKSSAKGAMTQSTSAWGARTRGPSSSTSTAKQASPKKMFAATRKHQVTMEEIPDESEQPDRSPSKFLAFDSSAILEPKPSKSAAMFDDIIRFDAESGSGPEDIHHRLVTEKQRVSPPVNVNPRMTDIDPAVLQRAAMQMRQGEERFSTANPNGVKTKQKSNSAWESSPNASGFMSESFDEPSLLSDGPATFGTQKPTSDQVWGSGSSSSPKAIGGIGIGKAKPSTATSDGFGTADGFGWESGSFGSKSDFWTAIVSKEGNSDEGEKSEEDLEREKEIMNSQRKLKDLFGDSTTDFSSKPAGEVVAGSPKISGAKARALKKQHEREEREKLERELREQYEAQEQEECEAQEKKAVKEAKEKEKEKEAASTPKSTGAKNRGKKGKGKR